MESTKIKYKNKIYYLNSKDLEDKSIKKLFAYVDKECKQLAKTFGGKTMMFDKNDIKDKLKETKIANNKTLIERKWISWSSKNENIPVGTKVKIGGHFGDISGRVGVVSDDSTTDNFSIVKISEKNEHSTIQIY